MMRTLVLVGIVLIVLGALGLGERGVRYTTREEVARLGPIEVTAERERTLSVPPAVSGVSLVAGIVLVGVGLRKR